ncbi:tetratricopeptide repeat protein [Amycolatopsis sp. WAC 04182]|uniref:tetratricopeptide repeat protein n=1 Tax=Amycolatopsis sp. WAC 04182 TaxID=2203198 RepID=UPI000F7B99CD|nr:tetratricopeptide repeat protein [Amycolatopsis sp. WAC 04182]
MTELVEVSSGENPVLDVVFVHGLDGDSRKSWSAKRKSTFWPEWLGRDIEGLAVWSLGYAAASSRWLGHAMPIQDRAINLLAHLESHGVGQRPLCFVTHSMGGLVVKEMLLHAADGRADYTEFATATRGVVFLATPHTGSDVVTMAVVKALSIIYRKTPAVDALERNSTHLRQLNTRYRNWAVHPTTNIDHKIFYETRPTKGVQVVDAGSADPGIPGQTPIPVDADHIDICKPSAPSDLVYSQVKRFITGIVTALQARPGATGQQETPRQPRLNETPQDVGAGVGRQASGVPVMESLLAVPGVGRIPEQPDVFVGRTHELARLEAAVAGSGGRAVVVAVHGLGGVGKSTLAARFAELHADRFAPVWWVTADSAPALESGLGELAGALAPETVALPAEQRVELAVRWLATHEDWLLVLDNVTSPQDVAGFLGRVRTGTVVITSRQRSSWRAVETVPLDVLAEDEALRLLTRIVRSEWPEADLAGADQLCSELGWLPLAVEQAGAYLAQTRTSPAAYLELLARFPARMFTATAEGGDAQRTMARVWHVTLDHLTDTPAAGRVLRQLAWYAPGGIPRNLLAGAVEELELSEALGRLAAYSMITPTGNTVTVHRLVQAVTRTPDPTDPHRQPADIATARDTTTTMLATNLSKLDPRTPADWPALRMLLPHARALLEHTTPDTDTSQTSFLLNELGVYLKGQGDISTAIDYYSRACDSHQRLNGPDHPYTLLSRNNLASAYESAGDLARAIPLYEATLTDRGRVLGPDHPDTLTSRNNLASAYESAGDLARTIPLYEATLTDRERVLGPDHPNTLTSRNNLAYAYRSAGDLARAIPLYEATLADRERVLGPDHPDTLSSRNNVASAYESAGDLARAIPLFEATLTDYERVLGPDHPDTLSSRNNLASAYESAGDLARAIPLYEATLADRERVLGPDHPNTLSSRNNLAYAYQSAGDLARAIPLYETTLADCERVLGPDHPDTLTSRNNLASAYQSVGDLSRAIPLYETTLTDRERVLGPDHPDTLTSRNNLAYAYRSAGDLARAIPLYETTLTDRERVLGPDHPNTLSSRNNLAYAYQSAGDLARAIPLYETTLTDRERVLGPDHPDTLTARNNLASAYQSVGDLSRAIPLYETTLTDRERVLGPDHPDTLSSRNNVASAYESAGDLARAIPLYETTLTDSERVFGPDHPTTQIIRSNLAKARTT